MIHSRRWPCTHVDDVLRTQRAYNRVLSAIGGEHDPVCGFQRRDVHNVIGLRPINGDGVEVEARLVEVSHNLDGVACNGAAIGACR